MLFAQIEGTTILFLGGLALTCAVLLFRTHRQLSARPKAELPPPASWSQPKPDLAQPHRLDAPRDLGRWEVEMHDLARDLNAQLDTKIGILQELIREAASQAERLEAALDEAGGTPIERAEKRSIAQPPTAKLARIDDREPRPGASAARRQSEIYSLADQGLSTAAIATRIGCPIGEVELILGLRGSLRS